jgi:hypothetical protein
VPARHSRVTRLCSKLLGSTIESHVFSAANRLKVCRITTRLFATRVMELIASRYWTELLLIGDAVGSIKVAEDGEVTVSVPILGALPNKALAMRHGVREDVALERLFAASLAVPGGVRTKARATLVLVRREKALSRLLLAALVAASHNRPQSGRLLDYKVSRWWAVVV